MLTNYQIRTLTSALTGLIVLVSLSVILLMTSAFLYPSYREQPGSEQTKTVAVSTKPSPMTEQQLHGKKLFVNNCAQCHAVTNEVIVGPGLQGLTS